MSELAALKAPVANAADGSALAANAELPEQPPRPAVDMFKSIFSDTSSSSDEDEPEEQACVTSGGQRSTVPKEALQQTTEPKSGSATAPRIAAGPQLPAVAALAQPAMKLTLANPNALELVAKAQQKIREQMQSSGKAVWAERAASPVRPMALDQGKDKREKHKKHKDEKVCCWIELTALIDVTSCRRRAKRKRSTRKKRNTSHIATRAQMFAWYVP